MPQNSYRDLIFTNHVFSRMKRRGIDSEQIWQTHKEPDAQKEVKDGAIERKKKFGDYAVSIIFKHNDKNEVVVISAWMDPPLPGSADAIEKEWWENYKKAGFFGKLWLTFRKQIGI